MRRDPLKYGRHVHAGFVLDVKGLPVTSQIRSILAKDADGKPILCHFW
jgi:hypothetical protein